MQKIYFLISLLLLTGCARFYNNAQLLKKQNINSGQEFVEACSLDGAWVRCTETGSNSSIKTLIAVSGNTMSETSFFFNSSPNCSGEENSSSRFNAEIIVGNSSLIPGASTLDIIPETDVFSCGLQQPAFTIFKLGSDCETLQIASVSPSCAADTRPAVFDSQNFNRL